MNPIHFRNILISSIIVLSVLVIVLIILLSYYGSKATKAIDVASKLSDTVNEVTGDIRYVRNQLVKPVQNELSNFLTENSKKEPKTKFGQFLKTLLSKWS